MEEVNGDPWGRPYKVVMKKMRSQPMPSPTCPVLLEKIVTVLFPQQLYFDHHIRHDGKDEIPPVTMAELRAA